jgi:hypothetical protein
MTMAGRSVGSRPPARTSQSARNATDRQMIAMTDKPVEIPKELMGRVRSMDVGQ